MVPDGAAAGVRWHSIQALRALAVLAVVGCHMVPVERKYSGGDLLLPASLWAGQLGVDLFFVISGFVMVAIAGQGPDRTPATLRFLWHRAARIYPTYWVYFLLTLAALWLQPQWVNASQNHHADLLRSFLLWPGEQLPLVMVAWSLIHELWFYLVFALLLRLPRRWLPHCLALWALSVLAVNLAVDPLALPPPLRLATHVYTLEFIAGALVALHVLHPRRPQLPPLPAALLGLAALLGGPWLIWTQGLLEAPPLWRVAAAGTACAGLVLAAVSLERALPGRVPQILVRVGDWSYTIYLSHLLVLGTLGRIWQALGADPARPGDNALALAAMAAGVLLYGALAWRWIERPLVGATRRLWQAWFERQHAVRRVGRPT